MLVFEPNVQRDLFVARNISFMLLSRAHILSLFSVCVQPEKSHEKCGTQRFTKLPSTGGYWEVAIWINFWAA